MSSTEALIGTVMKHPGEPEPLLVLADWLNDTGLLHQEYAARWLAKHGKHPHHRLRYVRPGVPSRKVPDQFSWGWYSDMVRNFDGPEHARLPHAVLMSIPRQTPYAARRLYGSWKAAFEDLARGLAELREVVSI